MIEQLMTSLSEAVYATPVIALAAAALLLAYDIGHCSVIVFAGTFTEKVQRYLNEMKTRVDPRSSDEPTACGWSTAPAE